MEEFIAGLPKAELHIHVEGSLEPELMLALARRNGVEIGFASVEELRAAYRFTDLQSFLDIYYAGAAVLRTEPDFYELMRAYLERAVADGVRRAEVFFDPQTHTARGVPFETVINGLCRAIDEDGPRLGVSAELILCFLRHLSEADALATLEAALPFRDRLLGVGLDSSERGHPPTKFARAFARARDAGLRVVAHAGEEGPPAYVREALDELGAERIDHGVRAIEDPALVARLARDRVPLTVCPLSNVRLKVFASMAEHPLARLLEQGVAVTIHSDDPAYFGGYITDNFVAAQRALGLSRGQVVQIARNGFEASFAPDEEKARHLAELDAYVAAAARS